MTTWAMDSLRLHPPLMEADEAVRPGPRKTTGPVLMGDLLTAPGGTPALLVHWDKGKDPD